MHTLFIYDPIPGSSRETTGETAKKIVSLALEQNAQAICVAEKDNFSLLFLFAKECLDKKIQIIPAVCTKTTEDDRMILIAKTKEGYEALCHIALPGPVSYAFLKENKDHLIAVSIFEEMIGKDTACDLEKIEKAIRKKEGKAEKYSGEIKDLDMELGHLEMLAGRNFVKKEKNLSRSYSREKEEKLNREKEDSRDALENLPKIKGKIARRKKSLEKIRDEITQLHIQKMEAERAGRGQSEQILHIRTLAGKYKELFGRNYFFIDILDERIREIAKGKKVFCVNLNTSEFPFPVIQSSRDLFCDASFDFASLLKVPGKEEIDQAVLEMKNVLLSKVSEEVYKKRVLNEINAMSVMIDEYGVPFSCKVWKRIQFLCEQLSEGEYVQSYGGSICMFLSGLSTVDPVKNEIPFEVKDLFPLHISNTTAERMRDKCLAGCEDELSDRDKLIYSDLPLPVKIADGVRHTAVAGFEMPFVTEFTVAISEQIYLFQELSQTIYRTRGVSLQGADYSQDVIDDVLKRGKLAGLGVFDNDSDRYVLANTEINGPSDLADLIQAKEKCSGNKALTLAVELYRLADLKSRYPEEFYCSAFNCVSDTSSIQKEYKNVLLPDINRSSLGYSLCQDGIMYGLSQIKGVNAEKILEHRTKPFRSMVDFIVRCRPDRNEVKALIYSGAMDRFSESRSGMLLVYEQICKRSERLYKIKSTVAEKKALIAGKETDIETEKIRKNILHLLEEARILQKNLSQVRIPSERKETDLDRRKMEAKVLPIVKKDLFDGIIPGTKLISEFLPGEDVKVIGEISTISFSKTSMGGMVTFTAEDHTGRLKAVIWPDRFEKYKDYIEEGNILLLYGSLSQDKTTLGCRLNVTFVDIPRPVNPQIVVMADSEKAWNPYKYGNANGSGGNRILVYSKETGQITITDVYSEKIDADGVETSAVRRYLRL